MSEPMTLPQALINGTKVPQTFPELLAVYKAKLADSKLDLTGEVNPMTRPGLEIRKNGAIGALPGLRQELGRIVESSSAAIFLTGEPEAVKVFVEEATEATAGNLVIVSAKDVYTRLAQAVEVGLRRDRRFNMDCLNFFVNGMMKLLDDLEVNDPIQAPNLVPLINRVFETTEPLAEALKLALNATKTSGGIPTGDGLNALFLQWKATEEAIEGEVATNFLPVIVLDATPAEVEGALRNVMYFGRNVDFEAKGEVTETTVADVFKKLKVQYKSRGVRRTK